MGDRAFISAGVPIHQFCRVGTLAMISAWSGVGMDVPPYFIVQGLNTVVSLNTIGLRRAGFTRERIKALNHAFRVIYRSGLTREEALAKLEEEDLTEEVRILVEFFRSSERGVCGFRSRKDDLARGF